MTEEVVISDDLGDLYIANLASTDVRWCVVDIDQPIDLGGLSPRSPLQQQVRLVAEAFDQNFESTPNTIVHVLTRDRLLHRHDARMAMAFDDGLHLIWHPGTERPFLLRVHEATEMIETLLTDKITQGLKVSLSLPWMADQDRGSQDQVVDASTQLRQQRLDLST